MVATMNLNQKSYYDAATKWLDRVERNNIDTPMPEVHRVREILPLLCEDTTKSFMLRCEYISCITIILKAAGKNATPVLSDSLVQEKVDEHIRALDKITPDLVELPPERRRQLVQQIKQLWKDIEDTPGVSKEAKEVRKGLLHMAMLLMSGQLGAVGMQKLGRYFSTTGDGALNGIFIMGGGVRTGDYLSADSIAFLNTIIQTIPELLHIPYVKRVVVEREFLYEWYIRLSMGEAPNKAMNTVIAKINFPGIQDELRQVGRDIMAFEEKWYKVCPKRKGNIVSTYQLEVPYRYCNMPQNFLFNFDDPGGRKTTSSIVAMILRMLQDGIEEARILVVCPPNLVPQWVNEINVRCHSNIVHAHSIHEDVLTERKTPRPPSNAKFLVDVVGSTSFSLKRILDQGYLGILTDESHNYKTREGHERSIRSTEFDNYINQNPGMYKIFLTGTPVINDTSEFANLINVTGTIIVPMHELLLFSSETLRALWLRLKSGPVVVRRPRYVLADIPKIESRFIDVVVGEERLKEALSLTDKRNNFSLHLTMAHESELVLPMINRIIDEGSKSKHLVYSHIINGCECKLLRKAYDQCPSGYGRIYIAGDNIVDINGNEMTYSVRNAMMVRQQFRQYNGHIVAYVSEGTSSEGVNEFCESIGIFYLNEPFTPSKVEQTNSRAARSGGDPDRTCVAWHFIVKYRDTDGRSFVVSNNNKVFKSISERLVNRLAKKANISSILLNGHQSEMKGLLLPWDDDSDETFRLIENGIEGKVTVKKASMGVMVALGMKSLATMPQDDLSAMNQSVVMYDNEYFKPVNSDSGIFQEVEKILHVKNSYELMIKKAKQYLSKNCKITHVGCGHGDLTQELSCLEPSQFIRMDLMFGPDEVIKCDRSAICDPAVKGHCIPGTMNMILFGNVGHWGHPGNRRVENYSARLAAYAQNISQTMFAFNQALIRDGYIVFAHPEALVRYPFAEDSEYLQKAGFKLLEKGVRKKVTYYILQKIFTADECVQVPRRLLNVYPSPIRIRRGRDVEFDIPAKVEHMEAAPQSVNLPVTASD